MELPSTSKVTAVRDTEAVNRPSAPEVACPTSAFLLSKKRTTTPLTGVVSLSTKIWPLTLVGPPPPVPPVLPPPPSPPPHPMSKINSKNIPVATFRMV